MPHCLDFPLTLLFSKTLLLISLFLLNIVMVDAIRCIYSVYSLLNLCIVPWKTDSDSWLCVPSIYWWLSNVLSKIKAPCFKDFATVSCTYRYLYKYSWRKFQMNINSNACYIFFSLGFQLRASCRIGKCSTSWATLPALFCVENFSDKVLQTICLGWLWTLILLINLYFQSS
jgi:hypothetical protein